MKIKIHKKIQSKIKDLKFTGLIDKNGEEIFEGDIINLRSLEKIHKQKYPRLESRVYEKIPYVLFDDIKKLHGTKWAKKFWAWFNGQTGVMVPANDISHGMKKAQVGVYFHDYSRGADLIDYNKPTYFD